MKDDPDFPIASIAEVITDRPSEYTAVRDGAKGIVTAVDDNEVYATWVNPDGENHEGYVLKENLRAYKPARAPVSDLRKFVTTLILKLERTGHRPPSGNAQKILELGQSWKGTSQLLYELVAWVDQCPEVRRAIRLLGTAWPTVDSKEKEDEEAAAKKEA